jgi:hypothetical protein
MDEVHALIRRAGASAERAGASAGSLGELAASVRVVAARVRATQGTPWRSVAADGVRDQVERLGGALDRTAQELDDAGQALRRHAATAQTRAGELAALALFVERSARDGLHDLAAVARRKLAGSLSALSRRAPWS